MSEQQLAISIIFEDQDLLVLNKPAGVVVNQAQTTTGETVQSWARNYLTSQVEWQSLVPADFDQTYGSPQEIFEERQGMVHRLDKDTSGVLVWAKNPGALVSLLAQFRQRQTQKTYLCLAHGKFGVEQAVLNYPMARDTHQRQKFTVSITGRPAQTLYEVKQFFSDLNWDKLATVLSEADWKYLKKNQASYQGFSLVECQPKTGRTHQIRVHLRHIKHPLVGDSKYGGKKRIKLDKLWCPRHFLHAQQLELIHPRTQEKVVFTAPLSVDLQQVLLLVGNEN